MDSTYFFITDTDWFFDEPQPPNPITPEYIDLTNKAISSDNWENLHSYIDTTRNYNG